VILRPWPIRSICGTTGITVAQVHRNLPLGALYEREASIVDNGALAACSGVKTGRSPKDKRVVKHPDSQADVWWGPVNIPIEPSTFATSPTKKRAMSKSCIAESIRIAALQRNSFCID